MIALRDPVGNITRWEYDLLGREVARFDPLGYATVTTYDSANRVATITDRLNRRREFTYYNNNRLQYERWYDPFNTLVNTLAYTYDDAGNVLTAGNINGNYTFTYDELGRVETQADPWGLGLVYDYNELYRTSVTDSLGGQVVSIYDARHLLTTRTFSDGQTQLRMDLTYTNRSELWTLRRASNLTGSALVGTSTFTYDPVGNLTDLHHKNASGGTIAHYEYGYDEVYRLTSDKLNGGAPKTYNYDDTYQLTSDNGVPYSYDKNGNRTMTGYVPGPGNRLVTDGTWAFTYDNEGNLIKKTMGPSAETWTYGYDHRNQLTAVEKRAQDGGTLLLRVEYKYDVFGGRIEERKWKDNNWVTQRFAYDGAHIWADFNGTGSLTTRREYLDAIDSVFARISNTGDLRWYLPDRLGSIRDITDNNSTVVNHIDYNAWGRILTESNPANGDRYGANGREVDRETLLQKNWWRELDIQTGGWIQEDPIGFSGRDTNLRRDVNNSPTNATDPFGLDAEEILKKLQGTPAGSGNPLADLVAANAANVNADNSLESGIREREELDSFLAELEWQLAIIEADEVLEELRVLELRSAAMAGTPSISALTPEQAERGRRDTEQYERELLCKQIAQANKEWLWLDGGFNEIIMWIGGGAGKFGDLGGLAGVKQVQLRVQARRANNFPRQIRYGAAPDNPFIRPLSPTARFNPFAGQAGHHPVPKFLGGNLRQTLSKLDSKIHAKFHSLLRAKLKDAGFPLNVGGKGGSAADWARYMKANPGSQRKAFDAVLETSRGIDAKHGTNLTQGMWKNVMDGNFKAYP